MFSIAEIISKIQELYTQKKETVFGIMVFLLLVGVIYILYGFSERTVDTCSKDIEALKMQHATEIKELRTDFINSQIEFNNEIRSCHMTCRKTIDSLDQYYYRKFLKLSERVNKINDKVNSLE